jgi:hypothetical protein
VGSTVFAGTLPAAATAFVAALVAGAPEPPEFVATTDTVSVLPMSPVTGT